MAKPREIGTPPQIVETLALDFGRWASISTILALGRSDFQVDLSRLIGKNLALVVHLIH